MASRTIDVYFDYLSVYAYLAWFKLQALSQERNLELRLHPVLLAGLLNHWGQLGPAEIPPKRVYAYSDSFRKAKLMGIDFTGPKAHPFNPLLALRLSLAQVGGEEQTTIIDTLWRAGWGKGIDMSSEQEIFQVLGNKGLDAEALLAKAKQDESKQALRNETEQAVARGVFGVPTMIVDQELFWGADSIDFLSMYLDGKDPLDRSKVEEMLARPKAVWRKRP